MMSNKHDLSYADFHHQITRNGERVSGTQQINESERKDIEGGMVGYASTLPSYLEKGKNFQGKLLNVGVLDWRHMEKRCNPMPNKSSGSSASTTTYYSTDESSSISSRGDSSSPGYQRMQHSSYQSHLVSSPVNKDSQDKFHMGRGRSSSPARQRTSHPVLQSHHPREYCLERNSRHLISLPGNASSVPNVLITQPNLCASDQTCGRNQSGIGLEKSYKEVSGSITNTELGEQQTVGNLDLSCSRKGKLRIRESDLKKEFMLSRQPNLGDAAPVCSKELQTKVLLLRDPQHYSRMSHLSGSSASNDKIQGEVGRKSVFHKDSVKELQFSDTRYNVPGYYPLPPKNDRSRQSDAGGSCSTIDQGVKIASQHFESPLKGRNTVDGKLIMGLKSSSSIKLSGGSDKRPGSESATRARHPSPIRRLSSAVGSIMKNVASRENSPLRRSSSKDVGIKPAFDRAVSSTSSDGSSTDKLQSNTRARSSPLRRLFEPIMKSKPPNVPKSTKNANDYQQSLKHGSIPLQALLQVAVKNGLPLFTFAVDNDTDILAATLSKLNGPDKACSSWIYTFFTVHEIKKKNGLWLNQGSKGNGNGHGHGHGHGHGYVPNVIAQMKVSTQKGANGDKLREFTLFSVDTGQVDQHATEFQPTNELAAIVVKLLESVDSRNLLNTTVILPGGVHTIPVKGSISNLTQRWRFGGSCDCGGWDVGCQLRVLTNQGESGRSSTSSKTANTSDEFKLFSKLGQDNQLVLSLNPFKDRIYSVEFDSSVSLLQAFATCVSVLDCQRPPGLFGPGNMVEGRASVAVMEGPASHISGPPPHSPFGRA